MFVVATVIMMPTMAMSVGMMICGDRLDRWSEYQVLKTQHIAVNTYGYLKSVSMSYEYKKAVSNLLEMLEAAC